jgi:EAL domain-containing protein (putative c-di-GMP-specific phosphodiesterase class I)
MYRVKEDGRNGFRFYSADMQAHSQRSLELMASLKEAIDHGELNVVYQPQRSLATGQMVGAEALLRWQHPRWGAVAPSEFIPLAEQSGLIVPIGLWVMQQVAAQLRQWDDAGLPPVVAAVNVSAMQFARPHLVEDLLDSIRACGMPPARFEVELTESVALKNPEAAGATLLRLSEAGFRVSLDDFGTGYSSMSYLRRYAINKLKIDQSFVRDLASSESDQAIVTAIVQMAHSLGMTTIAEGVETTEQQNLLQRLGCDEMQGYVYSRPLSPADFEALARSGRL